MKTTERTMVLSILGSNENPDADDQYDVELIVDANTIARTSVTVTPTQLKGCMWTSGTSPPEAAQLKGRGQALWDAWLDNDVGDKLLSNSSYLQGARLMIDTDCGRVLELPWEALYYDGHDAACVRPGCFRMKNTVIWRVLRGLTEACPVLPPVDAHFLLACPVDHPGYDTLWVNCQIEKLLSDWGVYVRGGICHPVTRDAVIEALRDRQLVYFIGHGEVTRSTGDPSILVVEDERNRASRPLTAQEMAACIGPELKLLVLNCCESARIATGILEEMRSRHSNEPTAAPAIVAVQWAWQVNYAFDLQEALTRSLVVFGPRSVSDAILGTRDKTMSDGVSWAAPTLFAGGEVANRGFLDGMEHPSRLMATVASDNGGPSVGPLGLTAAQVEAATRRLEECSAAGLDHLDHTVHAHVTKSLKDRAEGYQQECEIDPFEIDTHPVTVQKWNRMTEKIDELSPGNGTETPDLPVLVTAEDAQKFCKAAGGRLPTPWEWERAARGCSTTILPWTEEGQTDDLVDGWWNGDRMTCNVLEAGKPFPTGVFETEAGKSSFGVADMIGNAREWTYDPDQEQFLVMGFGCASPLVTNIPQISWRPPDKGDRGEVSREPIAGFRCVRDLPSEGSP